MKSEKLLDAFNYVEDQYLELAEKPRKKVISFKKRIITLIAAVICISMLSITAIAELPSVFQYLQQQDPEDAPLYEAAVEANLGKAPEPVELPQMKDVSLAVTEKYYNGETVLLGLDLSLVEGEPAIGFEPDALLMKELRSGSQFSPGYTDPAWYDTIPYPRKARNMAAELQDRLTQEEYRQVVQLMEETGHCCVVFQTLSVGDHIYVNGADTMATFQQVVEPSAQISENQESTARAIRLDSLAESARDQEEVTVQLKIASGYDYYYMDTQGHAYLLYNHAQDQSAKITISNSEMQ